MFISVWRAACFTQYVKTYKAIKIPGEYTPHFRQTYQLAFGRDANTTAVLLPLWFFVFEMPGYGNSCMLLGAPLDFPYRLPDRVSHTKTLQTG